jgi:T-complex protein 1 subunit zeta
VIPGAGSFEVAAFNDLEKFAKEVKGRAKLGVLAYANALLVIPETLAINAGFDASEKIVNLIEEAREVGDAGVLGLNLDSGDVEVINVRSFLAEF